MGSPSTLVVSSGKSRSSSLITMSKGSTGFSLMGSGGSSIAGSPSMIPPSSGGSSLVVVFAAVGTDMGGKSSKSVISSGSCST